MSWTQVYTTVGESLVWAALVALGIVLAEAMPIYGMPPRLALAAAGRASRSPRSPASCGWTLAR